MSRIFLFKFGWLSMHIKGKRAWTKQQRSNQKGPFHVHAIALNMDKRVQDQSLSFDTDAATIICDNNANMHICNNKSMFEGEIRRMDQHYIATIGRSKNSAADMGMVNWHWKDNDGKLHTIKIKDVLFFPASPVNILSVTSLADQFKDDDGTGIDTKRTKSRFYWDNNQFQRTINHPASNLPELPINRIRGMVAYTRPIFDKLCPQLHSSANIWS